MLQSNLLVYNPRSFPRFPSISPSLHCNVCEGSEVTAARAHRLTEVVVLLLEIISIKGPSHQRLTPFIPAQNIAIIGCLQLSRSSARFKVIKAGMLPGIRHCSAVAGELT